MPTDAHRAAHRGRGYAIALAAAIGGLGLANLVQPWLDTYTVMPSMLAVIVAAWYGGTGPGLLATVVSAIGIDYTLVEPRFALEFAPTPSDAIRIGFFTLAAVVASAASGRLARSDTALAESEQRLAGIIGSAMDAIITVDESQCIVLANTAAERVFGYEAGTLVGKPLELLIPQRFHERHRHHVEAFGAAGGNSRTMGTPAALRHDALLARRADGSEFPIEASISQVVLAGGRYFTVVLRDVTARVQGEEALRAANRDLAATTYALAHDLRSPLRAIDGYSRMLELDHAERLGPEAASNIGRVRANAQRMGHLVDGVLSLARLGRGDVQPEPVDLGVLAEGMIADLRRTEPERRVTSRIEGGLVAQADPRLASLVIQNLVGNAWKFTRGRDPGEIVMERAGTPGHGMAEFVVRDNGVGFAPEHGGQLFGLFKRLHHEHEFEGHGIGLATVRRAIERHGGTVRAEGTPGAGAAFYFTLPQPGGHEARKGVERGRQSDDARAAGDDRSTRRPR